MTRIPHTHARRRLGAVIPLFGLMLPVLALLAAFAINISYMQLTKTELRVATDAAARAGGRAWSEHQSVTQAKTFASAAARKNMVAGAPLKVRTANAKNEIEFGLSVRENNGYGRYVFTKKPSSDVEAGTTEATSIRITGKRDAGSRGGVVSLLFGGVGNLDVFEPVITSVCTQVDRDIALVLDRSGSMIFHEDYTRDAIASGNVWDDLYDWVQDEMRDIRRAGAHREGPRGERYWVWDDLDLRDEYNAMDDYRDDLDDYRDGGSGPSSSDDVPSPSRWEALEAAVNAFLDVLETTDQDEQVSLGSFSSSGRLELSLQTSYGAIRDWVANEQPWGGTAIDQGLVQSFNSLYGSMGRPYAAKTIVVLTDGQNNAGGSIVETAAENIVAAHNITIHTVTFSPGADQTTMKNVANKGGGKHYHANQTAELIKIFEDIANNLPTIITQ